MNKDEMIIRRKKTHEEKVENHQLAKISIMTVFQLNNVRVLFSESAAGG